MSTAVNLPRTIRRLELRARRVPLEAGETEVPYGSVTNTPNLAAAVAAALIGAEAQEVAIALHFDARMHLIGYHEVGRGTVTSCPVAPPEVFRTAIANGAASVILAHNHPSGSASPSVDDDVVTRTVARAGMLLRVPLLDHIIVTDSGEYYAYSESAPHQLALK